MAISPDYYTSFYFLRRNINCTLRPNRERQNLEMNILFSKSWDTWQVVWLSKTTIYFTQERRRDTHTHTKDKKRFMTTQRWQVDHMRTGAIGGIKDPLHKTFRREAWRPRLPRQSSKRPNSHILSIIKTRIRIVSWWILKTFYFTYYR